MRCACHLRTLVIMAYWIQPFQLAGGPSWLRPRRFDIAAKAPAGARKDQTWAMLQMLLADRFHLAVHREAKEMPIFDLVVAKGGLKIQPAHRAPGEADDSILTFAGRYKASMAQMSGLALVLSGMLGLRFQPAFDLRRVAGPAGVEAPSVQRNGGDNCD